MPAYLLPGEKPEVAHEFEEIEIVHTPPAGEEKERRPRVLAQGQLERRQSHQVRKDAFPIEKAFTSFIFRAVYQMVHDDGIGYEFLHGLAKRLHEKQEVALLGAGAKGTCLLVLRDKEVRTGSFVRRTGKRFRVRQVPPSPSSFQSGTQAASQIRMNQVPRTSTNRKKRNQIMQGSQSK